MDQKSSTIEALLDAQQAYWQQLLSGDSTDESEAWLDKLRQQFQAIYKDTPEHFSHLLDILGAQSEKFTEFGEQLLQQSKTCEALQSNEVVMQFQRYMQQQVTELLLRQWQIPEQFSSLFRTHSFRDDLLFENPFINGLKSLLETPTVGSNQDLQRQLRTAIKLTIEYQEALQAYIEHYSHINQQAVESMLHVLNESDSDINSLQQLHDIWVESYEAAYAKTVFTDAYQQAHGRISNALMQLRKYAQDERDKLFEAAGLATQQGLDTALKRQHALRKDMRVTHSELAVLKAQIAEIHQLSHSQTIAELVKEVAVLKEQLAQLKIAQAQLAEQPSPQHEQAQAELTHSKTPLSGQEKE